MKYEFFGRGIMNIIGVRDEVRSERHESMESWSSRLGKAGFRPFRFTHVEVQLPDYCDYAVSEGVVDLGFDSVPLVGVLAVEPA